MTSPAELTPQDLDALSASAMQLIQDRGAQVLNAIDDGVYFLDTNGRTLFINEAGSRMLGFTNREVVGRLMHELTHHHYADGTPFPAAACPILSSVTDGGAATCRRRHFLDQGR